MLGSKTLGLNVVELQFVMLANHDQNVLVLFRLAQSICKVEFIQPSYWLYSVPNLLVIQHLVTLYLGGFDVRVVSEIE